MFEILWYAMATLAPIDPAQESRLLPLTRYLRERGQQLKAPDVLFAQAYLQALMRPALEMMNSYDAILSPTLASLPAAVGYFDEVERAQTSSGRSGSRPTPPYTTCPASLLLTCHCTGTLTGCRSG